jgi:hypothetical protein
MSALQLLAERAGRLSQCRVALPLMVRFEL